MPCLTAIYLRLCRIAEYDGAEIRIGCIHLGQRGYVDVLPNDRKGKVAGSRGLDDGIGAPSLDDPRRERASGMFDAAQSAAGRAA